MGLFGGAGALGAAVAPAVGITYSRGWMYMKNQEFINNYNIHVCTMHMECSPDSADRLLQHFNGAQYKHTEI